jgi:chitinase
MPPSAVPWSLLTHILLAFGTLTSSFTVTIPAQSVSLAQEVFSTALANGVNPVLSIGGYGAGSQFFSAMVKTKTSRAVFLQSLLTLVQEYALAGVDLDWEYPGRESSAGVPFDEIEDVPNLLLLLQEMRATLPETVTISAALSSMYPWTANTANTTDLSPFAELLDWGALMDYNFLGVNSSITGSASPLTAGVGGKNIQMGAGNWTKVGMPWEKLVLGIPGYGRAWIMDDVCVPLSLVPCPLSLSRFTHALDHCPILGLLYPLCPCLLSAHPFSQPQFFAGAI